MPIEYVYVYVYDRKYISVHPLDWEKNNYECFIRTCEFIFGKDLFKT